MLETGLLFKNAMKPENSIFLYILLIAVGWKMEYEMKHMGDYSVEFPYKLRGWGFHEFVSSRLR